MYSTAARDADRRTSAASCRYQFWSFSMLLHPFSRHVAAAGDPGLSFDCAIADAETDHIAPEAFGDRLAVRSHGRGPSERVGTMRCVSIIRRTSISPRRSR